MPTLTPVDLGYLDRAPQRVARTWSIPHPAQAIWAELVGERPLHWCRGLDIRWTSPPPHGIGSTRRAKALGLLAVEERFFHWEEGRRHAFYFSHVNLPIFTAAAEDYLVEPDGADRCRLTWRVGVTPSTVGRPGLPVNQVLFHRWFAETGRFFGSV